MNKITDTDIAQKIAKVEIGDTFPSNTQQKIINQFIENDQRKVNGELNINSIAFAIEKFPEQLEESKRYSYWNDVQLALNDTTGLTIYGTVTSGRYYVRVSGEVVFSMIHSNEEQRARAIEMGFNLFY